MKIKIPFMRRDKAKPLADAIDRAADRSGIPDHQILMSLSYVLEEIGAEMCRGRAITIPGFGMFAPVLVTWQGKPRCRVKFSPSPGLRSEVGQNCPIVSAPTDQFLTHTRNSSRTSKKNARPFLAMEIIRQSIRKQMAGTV